MESYTRNTVLLTFMLCIALPARGQQYQLYTPQPVASGQKEPSQNGILVQEIEIRKGDTLSALSRKFNGKGMYYPQILLFNSIKNPDLIYTGKTLRIPLSHNESRNSDTIEKPQTRQPSPITNSETHKKSSKAASKQRVRQSADTSTTSSPSIELSLSDLKTSGSKKSRARKKTAPHAENTASSVYPRVVDPSMQPSLANQKQSVAPPEAEYPVSAGQKLFEAAVRSYRRNDCRTAIEQFDRYLADNSTAPQAADASLYKAECYLKLSAQ